jgi:hypothetical protein
MRARRHNSSVESAAEILSRMWGSRNIIMRISNGCMEPLGPGDPNFGEWGRRYKMRWKRNAGKNRTDESDNSRERICLATCWGRVNVAWHAGHLWSPPMFLVYIFCVCTVGVLVCGRDCGDAAVESSE